ncbi:MAG: hypothetical protein GY922_17185 [Proteobacteria bacterium]|nr:hypothetical protein [Pseudomonadota bacterium]
MDRSDDTRGAVENAICEAAEISGGERVLCLETQTGELIWEYPYDCLYQVAYPRGPRCTPLVDVMWFGLTPLSPEKRCSSATIKESSA